MSPVSSVSKESQCVGVSGLAQSVIPVSLSEGWVLSSSTGRGSWLRVVMKPPSLVSIFRPRLMGSGRKCPPEFKQLDSSSFVVLGQSQSVRPSY